MRRGFLGYSVFMLCISTLAGRSRDGGGTEAGMGPGVCVRFHLHGAVAGRTGTATADLLMAAARGCDVSTTADPPRERRGFALARFQQKMEFYTFNFKWFNPCLHGINNNRTIYMK